MGQDFVLAYHFSLMYAMVSSSLIRSVTIANIASSDGTSLLDIKPYIENFDTVINSTSGWMTADLREVSEKRSDDRFMKIKHH